ncbi:MAG: hypothetical protein JW829_19850 [Pirellulales bacterium]|nr:hypothetical protein [Pirellulales bacterium]
MKRCSVIGVLSVVLAIAVSSVAFAQPAGRPGQRGPGMMGRVGMGGGMGGGEMMLLMNEEVRKEIGLLDDQVEKLREMQEGLRDEAREAFSGFQDLNEDERNARMKEWQTKTQERVKEILIPNQWQRLQQISLQVQMQRAGGGEANAIGDALGLSDDEKEKLQAKAQEISQELQQKIDQLREQAREDLIGSLTPEQQAKLKELTGKKFEFSEGFGGGPFGRGMDRGQRGDRGQTPRGDRGQRSDRRASRER